MVALASHSHNTIQLGPSPEELFCPLYWGGHPMDNTLPVVAVAAVADSILYSNLEALCMHSTPETCRKGQEHPDNGLLPEQLEY